MCRRKVSLYGWPSSFNLLLRWQKFVVITDSNTVLHWSTMKDLGGTIGRWLDFIPKFNFTVTHLSSKHNVNANIISHARHMSEPSPSTEGTNTQTTANVYKLPWLSGNINQSTEHYIPPSCKGKVCSVVELQWNHRGILQVIMVWNAEAVLIAYNKCIIYDNAEDLYRAQGKDSILQKIRSWINKYLGEVDDKKIMQEMEELHLR